MGGKMVRYLAGVASALLLVTAGFLIWNGRAERQSLIPPAPPVRVTSAPRGGEGGGETAKGPPSAPEKPREERRSARYDNTQEGIITRAEMINPRRKPFQKLDTN